jgi:uncharacterized membrane protein
MKKNGYIVFGFLALVWGLTYLFNKTASHYITPTQIVMIRVSMGFLPLFLIALLHGKLKWSHLRHTHHFVVMSLLAASVYYYFRQRHRDITIKYRKHSGRSHSIFHLHCRLAVSQG